MCKRGKRGRPRKQVVVHESVCDSAVVCVKGSSHKNVKAYSSASSHAGVSGWLGLDLFFMFWDKQCHTHLCFFARDYSFDISHWNSIEPLVRKPQLRASLPAPFCLHGFTGCL